MPGPQLVDARDGQLTVAIPELLTTRGHASNIGDDVAFKIVRRAQAAAPATHP